MVFDIEEAERSACLKGKMTAVIASCQAPIECLMWSVFSLLLRSKPGDRLEHIIVTLNGPDKRTGDPSLQDEKQAFLEELRDIRWMDERDMPLTVIRAWSRVGHAQAVEMALPWVHTEAYILMHDDVIVNDENWIRVIENPFFTDEQTAAAFVPPLLVIGLDCYKHQGEWLLRFPHPNTAFVVCRKSLMQKLGASWCGYHLKQEFDLSDQAFCDELLRFHRERGHIQNLPIKNEKYGYVSQDIGAWVYYRLLQENMRVAPLPSSVVTHFIGMSWGDEAYLGEAVPRRNLIVSKLEAEIDRVPEFKALYQKYKKKVSRSGPDLTLLRPFLDPGTSPLLLQTLMCHLRTSDSTGTASLTSASRTT